MSLRLHLATHKSLWKRKKTVSGIAGLTTKAYIYYSNTPCARRWRGQAYAYRLLVYVEVSIENYASQKGGGVSLCNLIMTYRTMLVSLPQVGNTREPCQRSQRCPCIV